MSRRCCIVIIFLAGFLFLLLGDATPNEVIIKTSDIHSLNREGLGLSELDSFLFSRRCTKLEALGNTTTSRYFVATLPEGENLEEIFQLEFEGVEYIQPNYLNEFFVMPDDPYLYEQSMDIVNAASAWNLTTGSRNIIAGVIDSGLHYDHPDLQENIYINNDEIPAAYFSDIDINSDGFVTNPEIMQFFTENSYDNNGDGEITHEDVISENSVLMDGIDNDENGYMDDIMGWDFTDASELANIASGDYLIQDNYPEDEYNHGTHVAGIIGATADNGEGISGICWEVSLLCIRAGFKTADGLSGVLQDDDAAAGIIYAADMGADVINLSWGDYVNSPVISDACAYANQKGAIIVVSAGNTASEGLMYPARLSSTISVGAVDAQRERFWQSSYGYQLDIMAPGVNVMSCYDIEDTYYERMSGTSMSAPYVSGAIALLLSREPHLNFDNIRSRLNLSADAASGNNFDPYYGYGILNIAALLRSQEQPCIEIQYPADNNGISSDTAIFGTVESTDFYKYTVMFSSNQQPEDSDWRSVEAPHSLSPNWQMQPVIDGQLAWFDIPDTDGEYLMKVELVTTDNQHYIFPWNISIDQTPPIIDENNTFMQYRFEGENLVNYLALKFNEPVDVEAALSIDGNDEMLLYSSNMDSIHYLRLPLLADPGFYTASISSTNICGLCSNDILEGTLEVKQNCLNYNSWDKSEIGEALVCLPEMLDIDYDENYNDFIGMYVSENMERTVSVWEATGTSISSRFQIEGLADNFWPHSWGNQNGSNFELVGVEANTAVVYEVNNDFAQFEWSLNNSYGGSFIDFNHDGIDDLALVQNVTMGNVTYRVLGLHKKFGSSWQTIQLIYNETDTYSKNEFLNQVECGDFDGDGNIDIFTADNDGDLIIYEYNSESETFIESWQTRLPLQNTDYITSGNFQGDDTKEFCAGVWNYDSSSSEKTYSWFAILGNNGSDNQYEVYDVVIFDEYRENMGICSADTDGDDYDEIIIAADPYIYIIDHVDTDGDMVADSFLPVWQGDSDQHYPKTISAVSATENSSAQIFANSIAEGERHFVTYYPAEDFSGPPSVAGFQVNVAGADSAVLSWLEVPAAESYRIYRKRIEEEDYFEILVADIMQLSFIDTTLTENTEYSYRIRAYNSSYTPTESKPSYWQSIKTAFPPQIVNEIKMSSPWNLEIVFDKTLANSASNTGHYLVNNNAGRPVSVNMISQKQGVLLTFSSRISEADDYKIEIIGLQSEAGVAFPDGEYSFNWQEDTFSPRIVECQVISNDQVKVIFNEPVQQTEDIKKYYLDLPEADSENYITDVVSGNDHVVLNLAKPIIPSNQLYYLRVKNISDLAGNYINSLGNKTQFALTNSSLQNMITYPNPFYTEKYSEFRFALLPSGKKGEVWIYDLTGELVYNSAITPRSQLDNYFSWKGKNSSGKSVSSGLYFYILQIGDEMQKGKIAVVN